MNQGLKRKLMFRKAGKRIPPLNKERVAEVFKISKF